MALFYNFSGSLKLFLPTKNVDDSVDKLFLVDFTQ